MFPFRGLLFSGDTERKYVRKYLLKLNNNDNTAISKNVHQVSLLLTLKSY